MSRESLGLAVLETPYVGYLSGTFNSICRILSVWGHSVHFAKLLTLRQAAAPAVSRSLNQIYRKHVHIFGGNTGLNFSGYLPNLKSIWHVEDKLPQLHCQYP